MLTALLDPLTWLLPIAVSLIALVWAEVRPVWLTKWYDLLLWVETHTHENVTKPIGGCAKCTAGFWSLVLMIAHDWQQPVAYLTSASLAILLGAALTKIYQWTQR